MNNTGTYKKEQATENFLNMICKSWTWARLTKQEKIKFLDMIYSYDIQNRIKGTYNDRVDICNMIYHSFLLGLGYNPTGWREPDQNTETPKF